MILQTNLIGGYETENVETCKNFGPILESRPIASATSFTSAPVASQTEQNHSASNNFIENSHI